MRAIYKLISGSICIFGLISATNHSEIAETAPKSPEICLTDTIAVDPAQIYEVGLGPLCKAGPKFLEQEPYNMIDLCIPRILHFIKPYTICGFFKEYLDEFTYRFFRDRPLKLIQNGNSYYLATHLIQTNTKSYLSIFKLAPNSEGLERFRLEEAPLTLPLNPEPLQVLLRDIFNWDPNDRDSDYNGMNYQIPQSKVLMPLRSGMNLALDHLGSEQGLSPQQIINEQMFRHSHKAVCLGATVLNTLVAYADSTEPEYAYLRILPDLLLRDHLSGTIFARPTSINFIKNLIRACIFQGLLASADSLRDQLLMASEDNNRYYTNLGVIVRIFQDLLASVRNKLLTASEDEGQTCILLEKICQFILRSAFMRPYSETPEEMDRSALATESEPEASEAICPRS